MTPCMMRGRPAARVVLNADTRVERKRRVRAATTSQRDARRARIALLAADGMATEAIATELGVSVAMVCRWRGRLARATDDGEAALLDLPRSGRPPRLDAVTRCEILAAACEPAPSDEGVHGWTLDRLVEVLGTRDIAISRSHLHTLLTRAEIKPHKTKQWVHSRAPLFREKTAEIVSLCLDPPEGAVVLSIDEKTGMQALERTNPDRPAQPGKPTRREFEYVRHGTQALISALHVHCGDVFAACGATRKADDLESFMERVAQRYAEGAVHVIWDNLNIHHGERWQDFNVRHGGRFVFHYTPLHASWVNQIEPWFGILARRCLRHGSFESVEALRRAVLAFVEHWKHSAGPCSPSSSTGTRAARSRSAGRSRAIRSKLGLRMLPADHRRVEGVAHALSQPAGRTRAALEPQARGGHPAADAAGTGSLRTHCRPRARRPPLRGSPLRRGRARSPRTRNRHRPWRIRAQLPNALRTVGAAPRLGNAIGNGRRTGRRTRPLPGG
jgi:transposase